MILFIDTTDREQAQLAMIAPKALKQLGFTSPGRLSESLPVQLQKLLKSLKLKPSDIKKIAVVRGPGSFVGTRTGVAFANALAWALNLPVSGVTRDEVPSNLQDLRKLSYKRTIIPAKYAAPPNITQPKPRK